MKQVADFRKDELLEVLWHLNENHDLTLEALKEHDPTKEFEDSLREFATNGTIKFDGKDITLTDAGEKAALGIIRRHRLAERLLADVLGKAPEDTEKAACEFEHVLEPGLVESICILLGHPKKCPHGSPIPAGKCCEETQSSIESAVLPLIKMNIGSSAKISSINTRDDIRMHKLFSLGIVPGAVIKLHQVYPALVLEVEDNQVALEESIGKEINVWRPEKN